MSFYLVDGPPRPFRPLGWTRPLSELLFGAESFRERIERLGGRRVDGVFAKARFEGLPFSRLNGSGVRVSPRDPAAEPMLLLDSLYVPTGPRDPALAPRSRGTRLWLEGALVGACLTGSAVRQAMEALGAQEDWRGAVAGDAEDVELPGRRPAALHWLVAESAAQIAADLEGGADRASGAPVPAGIHVEGPSERLHVAAGVELVPPVYVDVREGRVRLDERVRVEPFTCLRGPLVVRSGTRVLGGEIGASTFGPGCKVRGEIVSSVFLGNTNKAHEGFVGDSYVGEWVNLGAGTTTSNLKNNYGAIRMRLNDEVVETGLLKLGSLLGDHVKTGIGTLLPTGAVVGPGTNLYGARGPAPGFLPAFSWGAGTRQETHRLEAFLESARVMMRRRGIELDVEEAGMLGAVFRATESERITPA